MIISPNLNVFIFYLNFLKYIFILFLFLIGENAKDELENADSMSDMLSNRRHLDEMLDMNPSDGKI